MTTAFPSRPVTLLSTACALLVVLIAGQGTYLYRLEREEAQVRLKMERTQALYDRAGSCLKKSRCLVGSKNEGAIRP